MQTILWLLNNLCIYFCCAFHFHSLFFFYHKCVQTIHDRHKTLLQKAQEELEGNTSNKLSLRATLTDQIKEQESSLAAVKEVLRLNKIALLFWFSVCWVQLLIGLPLTRLTDLLAHTNRTHYAKVKQIPNENTSMVCVVFVLATLDCSFFG